jgi:hypothetical protein
MKWLIEKISHIWESPDPYDLALLPVVSALFLSDRIPIWNFWESLGFITILVAIAYNGWVYFSSLHRHL